MGTTVHVKAEFKGFEQLRSLFNCLDQLISVYKVVRNPEGLITDRILKDANEPFLKAINAPSLESVVNKTAVELYGSELAKLHLPVIRQVMDTRSSLTIEGHNPALKRDFLTTYHFLDDDHFMGASDDITTLKETEQQLKRNEENLSAILKATTETVWLLDLEGTILSANPTAVRRFGLGMEEVIGKPGREFLSPELWKSRKAMIDKMVRLNDVVRFEDERDGSIFSNNYYPVRDPAGTVVAVAIFSYDITESRQAEQERISQNKLYRSMFEHHKAIILLIDPSDGSIRDANTAASKFYGYSAKKLCSMLIRDIIVMQEEEHSGANRNNLTGEKNAFLFQHRLADNSIRWVEVYPSPVESDGKTLLYSIIHDVTNRKNAEQERIDSLNFLRMINICTNTDSLVKAALGFFREKSGCEAAGIRLKHINDFPYHYTSGFTEDIIRPEQDLPGYLESTRSLINQDNSGVADCLCSTVIAGTFNPDNYGFTVNGSFVSPLPEINTGKNQRTITCKRCKGGEYASLALIPLHLGNDRIGLIQLNDHRTGFFQPGLVSFFEQLAAYLTIALSKLQVEEELKKSEQLFRALAANSPDHIIVQDHQLRYTMVSNPQLGLTERDMLGKTDYDLVSETEAHSLSVIKRSVLETGNPVHVEVPITGINGKIQHFSGIYVPLCDEEGNTSGIVGYFRDVTEQKNSEEEIRRYTEHLEEIVDLRTSDILKTNEHLSIENAERMAVEEELRQHTDELEQYRYNLQELVKERTAELVSNNMKLAKEIVTRRQAEKALKESERKFREIAQNVPGIIFQLRFKPDGSNYFSYMSPRASEDYDLPPELSDLEKGLIDHLHPDDKPGFLASVARVINDRIPWNFEGRIVKANMETRWFHSITSPSHVGEELILDGIMFDITDRKQAEINLQVSLTKYRVLFDSFPQGLTVSDDKGNIIESNREAERLLGISQSRLLDRSIDGKEWQLIKPDGRIMSPKDYASVRSLRTKKVVENVEMGIRKNDGTITWINVSAAPIPLDSFGVVIAYNDITRRKNIEAARIESEKRYHDLFEAMTEGFALHKIICDDQGNPVDYLFLNVNRAFEKLTGLKKESVIGKKLSEVLPNENPVWPVFYGKVALTGRAATLENYSMSLKRYYEVHAYCPVIGHFAVIFRDITKQKELESAYNSGEKKYKTLANSISGVFFTIDTDLHITFWNKHTEQVTGIRSKEAVGKKISTMFADNSDFKTAVRNFQQVISNRKKKKFVSVFPGAGVMANCEYSVIPSANCLLVFCDVRNGSTGSGVN